MPTCQISTQLKICIMLVQQVHACTCVHVYSKGATAKYMHVHVASGGWGGGGGDNSKVNTLSHKIMQEEQ